MTTTTNSEDYQELYAQLKKLDKSFRDIESGQRKYSKIMKKVLGEEKTGDLDDKNSKALHDQFQDISSNLLKSEHIISLSLEQLNTLIDTKTRLLLNGESLLKKRTEEKPLPPAKRQRTASFSGESPIPVGHQVAALVGENEWILAVVVKFSSGSGKYQVRDVDEEEQQFYTLAANDIIPTQGTSKKVGGFNLQYELDKGDTVLAVFPETTVFYRATVVSSLRKHKKISEYYLHFDDDEEGGVCPKRKISAKFVVPYSR